MGGQAERTGVSDAKAAESLLAFWAQSGVDTIYAEAPLNRLIEKPRAKPAAAPVLAPVTLGPQTTAPVLMSEPAPQDVAQATALAKAAAEGVTSLEELAEAIAAFDGCPLKFQGASRAVFARGDPAAPVMVIGEGPGADEDRQGAPFVGRAGQLLDKMLAAAGLENRVFITNTVFWRPPGNRTPTLAEQAICRPFLDKAIELVQPRFLLLAGGAAAKSVLSRDEGIMSLRGRWFEWSNSDQTLVVPAIPTLHPAFLLRQGAAKKKAWTDLLRLTERVDRPERAP